MDEVLEQCLPHLVESHTGPVCDVCGQEKWFHSPFCRDCSLKLQRIGLMAVLVRFQRNYGQALHTFKPYELRSYFRHWDRARDYLIVAEMERVVYGL